MGNLDFFGQKMFAMGFTQIAPPLNVQPAVYGPPPYGIWPVSFAPQVVEPEEVETQEDERERELGQAAAVPVVPVEKADLFGVILGMGAIGAGVYVGAQPGPQSFQRYLAPGAAALAGLALLVKSL